MNLTGHAAKQRSRIPRLTLDGIRTRIAAARPHEHAAGRIGKHWLERAPSTIEVDGHRISAQHIESRPSVLLDRVRDIAKLPVENNDGATVNVLNDIGKQSNPIRTQSKINARFGLTTATSSIDASTIFRRNTGRLR